MKIVFKNFINLTKSEHIEILNLRNSKFIRVNMKDSKIIDEESHFKWIITLRQDRQKEYFAIFLDGQIQGAISWVKDEQERVFWGIYHNKDLTPMVPALSAYLFIDYLFKIKEFTTIDSYIKKSNQKSYNFTKSFGFTQICEDEEFYYLALDFKRWNDSSNTCMNIIKRYLAKIEHSFQ